LGAYLQLKPLVTNESVLDALKKVLPEKYQHLLEINRHALESGASMIKQLKTLSV